MFKIESISNRVVKAGALVTVTSFIVVDASGALVSGTKSYDTEAEAQAKIDSMGNLSAGLEFAQASFPDLASKAQIGKANVIAQYLDWIAAGKPVASNAPAAEPDVEPAVEEPAAALVSEEEEF